MEDKSLKAIVVTRMGLAKKCACNIGHRFYALGTYGFVGTFC